jgi:ribosomal protein L24E
MLGYDGTVYPFGSARLCPDAHGRSRLDVSLALGIHGTAIVPMPDGLGYWALDSNGNVDAFKCANMPHNDAVRYEGANRVDRLGAGERTVSLSALPDGTGYWVFTDHGRVIPFGHAKSYGGMSNVHLNGPVLGSVATPSGHGYYMLASDGGIFTFGDAHFRGSMGGRRLSKPVVSMAPTSDGKGYWLVASDGGVFSFNARFYGSTGRVGLRRSVVGIVGTTTGHGYLMVASDGGVFAFGDVAFHGSLAAHPPVWPITSVAVVP